MRGDSIPTGLFHKSLSSPQIQSYSAVISARDLGASVNLVAGAQLIDGQDLSGAESFCKQVNGAHLSTEDTVHVGRLRRSEEALVERLRGGNE